MVLRWVWKATRCMFNSCAGSLRGAVLGNIFHPCWCRSRRQIPPMALIYQPCMFTCWAANSCTGSSVPLAAKSLSLKKHKTALHGSNNIAISPEPGVIFTLLCTMRSKELPTRVKAAGWDYLNFHRNEGEPQTFAFLSKQI